MVVSNITRVPGNNVYTDALSNGIKNQQTASSLWLENAGYLRLDNLTLAYTFKNIKGIQNLRVYASGNNLFVITQYKGIDPEQRTAAYNNPGSNNNPANYSVNTEAYIDANYGGTNYYPRARSFAFGVNLTFN